MYGDAVRGCSWCGYYLWYGENLMDNLMNLCCPFRAIFHKPKGKERGGEPIHNQPRIILMHNNPLRVISIRTILSWLRMDRGITANASWIDRMSVLAEFLIQAAVVHGPRHNASSSAFLIYHRLQLFNVCVWNCVPELLLWDQLSVI